METTKFSDHEGLHIESRPIGEKLTPNSVFGYLVEKGLFRVGADINCPSCKLTSWVSLDLLKHKVMCDLCGNEYDVSRKLSDANQLHYRRSGVLGVEKNAQGAIPVSLTLQQLDTTFRGVLQENMYSPSLDLTPKTDGGVRCETDFVWVISRDYPKKTVVILAECKDKGPITVDDVNKLKNIADALPRKRFDTFVILSQIAEFTSGEIELAKTLNEKYRDRVILLSAKELEPYFIRDRDKGDSKRELKWFSPEEMASSTVQLYFSSTGDVADDSKEGKA